MARSRLFFDFTNLGQVGLHHYDEELRGQARPIGLRFLFPLKSRLIGSALVFTTKRSWWETRRTLKICLIFPFSGLRRVLGRQPNSDRLVNER